VACGIPSLGFRIYPTHRRLKKRRGIAFQRRFRNLYRDWLAGSLSRQRLDAAARSWSAHAARLLTEIGRLLGGWQKSVSNTGQADRGAGGAGRRVEQQS